MTDMAFPAGTGRNDFSGLELDRLLHRRPWCSLSARSTKWIVRTPGGAFCGESLGDHEVNGGLGGVHAGCDYQLAGGFVVGIQGDYSFAVVAGHHDTSEARRPGALKSCDPGNPGGRHHLAGIAAREIQSMTAPGTRLD